VREGEREREREREKKNKRILTVLKCAWVAGDKVSVIQLILCIYKQIISY